MGEDMETQRIFFEKSDWVPNNQMLPVIVYREIFICDDGCESSRVSSPRTAGKASGAMVFLAISTITRALTKCLVSEKEREAPDRRPDR